MEAPKSSADLDIYFDLVLGQHGALLRQAAQQEGPGIATFEFFAKPKPNGSNCQFRYCEKGGLHWNFLVGLDAAVAEQYSPEKHLLVCVAVPTNDYNSERVGELRLYDAATAERVAVRASAPGSPGANTADRTDNTATS